MRMNCCDYQWELRPDVCPCDVHFNQWVAEQDLRNKTIYHFGTGSHHMVGIEQATNGSGNAVLAITASTEEFDAYVKLVSARAEIARAYVAYFGDIYLTNKHLLPEFDVVTMFHLHEFSWQMADQPGYKGLTDRQLLDLFALKVRPGGHILFYPGSMGWKQTKEMLPGWQEEHAFGLVGEYKRLLVYRKAGSA